MSTIPAFGSPAYALTTTVDLGFADAVTAARAALADEGFGVLTEIDVQATLDKKLGAKTRPYLILGACNPPLAHQALQAEPGVGVLLPCNVVVSEADDGRATVSAIDPMALFSVVGRPDIEPVAADVKARLERVIAALGGAS